MRARMVVSLLVSMAAASVAITSQAVPAEVPYFGLVTFDTGAPYTGTLDVTLEIFDGSSGTNSVWGPHTWPNHPIENGLFAVSVGGSGSPPLNQTQLATTALWAQWTLAGTAMSPRQHVQAVPYALHATNAAQLGGQPPSAYVAVGALAAVATSGSYADLGRWSRTFPPAPSRRARGGGGVRNPRNIGDYFAAVLHAGSGRGRPRAPWGCSGPAS